MHKIYGLKIALGIFGLMFFQLFIQFQSPLYLWGLLLIAIPVLIHLFSFRNYKEVLISDLSLLKSIKKSGVAKNKIKELLILLSRVFAIIFLVLAFANPKDVSETAKKNKRLVKIYLDNSLSMLARDQEVTLLEKSKVIAEQIIDLYGVNDRFQIETNDFTAESFRSWQKKEAKNKIAQIVSSTASRSLLEVNTRFKEPINGAADYTPVEYWLSDFETLADSLFFNQLSHEVYGVPLVASDFSNVFVDSVWFKNPVRKFQGTDTLDFKVSNAGKLALEDFQINLLINGNQLFTELTIPANSSTEGFFAYRVPSDKTVKGKVYIEDQPMTHDNQKFFTYSMPEKINVLVVSSSEPVKKMMSRLFEKEENVAITFLDKSEISYSVIDRNDVFVIAELKVLDQSLLNWLMKINDAPDKQIIVVPSEQIDIASYNEFGRILGSFELGKKDTSKAELLPVTADNDFFKDVFHVYHRKRNVKLEMPKVWTHYEILNTNARAILFYSSGSPYLVKNDKLTLFSSGLSSSSSSFESHPLIVPLFYKLIFSSALKSDLYQDFGKKSMRKNNKWPQELEVVSPDSIVFKPRLIGSSLNYLAIDDNFSKEGWYEVFSEDSLLGYIALNYNNSESRKDHGEKTLTQMRKSAQKKKGLAVVSAAELIEKVKAKLHGQEYWKYLLMLSGAFLLLEMCLIKFKKQST